MKLNEFPAESLRRAVAIYLEEAWADVPCPRAPTLPPTAEGALVEELLPPKVAAFRHEPKKPPEHIVDEYSLQVGNRRYGLMKLVLGENLIVGEYFLSVDTHDWMFKPDANDLEEKREWEATLAFNVALKERIEQRWNEAQLPTLRDLRNYLSSSQQCAVVPRGQRVLVVDDDKVAAEILALFLGSRGFEVELAHDGVAGLAAADPTRHQLIVMDVDMPKKNGLEVCAELKADPRRAAIPILLSSKRPLGERPPAGANAFLVKPFQAHVLLYFVESLLPRQPPPAPPSP